ncbi:MAG: S1C family serine protease [Thermoleophilia bacterium]
MIGLGRGWGRGSGVVVADGLAIAALGPGGGHGPFRGRGPGHGPHHPGMHRRPRFEDGPGLTVTLADGRQAEAEFAGRDPRTGLAVLRLDTTGITPVVSAPADAEAGIGTPVVAMANPGGRGLRVTHGYVAGETRSIEGPRGRRIEAGLEHTAPMPRGASGGPLLTADGELLGINLLRPPGGLVVAVTTGADVAARAAAVASGQAPRQRSLGVALAPPHVAARLRRAVGLPETEGLLVRGVETGSAAERAGLQQGDLLTHAAGAPLADIGTLASAIDAAPGDGTLVLTVVRGTEPREVTVTLAEDD